MVSATTSFTSLAESELKSQILANLRSRQVPALRRLAVDIAGGVVTLHGEVRTFYEQQLVQQCCRKFEGLAILVNQVHVRG